MNKRSLNNKSSLGNSPRNVAGKQHSITTSVLNPTYQHSQYSTTAACEAQCSSLKHLHLLHLKNCLCSRKACNCETLTQSLVFEVRSSCIYCSYMQRITSKQVQVKSKRTVIFWDSSSTTYIFAFPSFKFSIPSACRSIMPPLFWTFNEYISYCLENHIHFSFTVYKGNASPQTSKRHI